MIDKGVIKENIILLYELDEEEREKAKLDIMIDRSVDTLWNFCNLDVEYNDIEELPHDIYGGIVEELAMYEYSRLGREDKMDINFGGNFERYSTDIPLFLQRKLYKYRFMRFR